MVRGHGLDRIQVYARIVHQLTSELMKPILEHCVWGPPTRQQKEPFNANLTRPGSYKSTFISTLMPSTSMLAKSRSGESWATVHWRRAAINRAWAIMLCATVSPPNSASNPEVMTMRPFRSRPWRAASLSSAMRSVRCRAQVRSDVSCIGGLLLIQETTSGQPDGLAGLSPQVEKRKAEHRSRSRQQR